MGPRVAEQGLSKLALRVVSSIALIAITATVVWLGPPAFDIFILIAAIVLAWEWSRLCGQTGFGAPMAALLASTIAIMAVAAFIRPAYGLAACAVSMLFIFGVAHFSRAERAGWLAFGALYIGLPALALVWIARDPLWGRETLALLIVIVAATDIGAFFVGRAIGGPKLAPGISPQKTWAGLAGGIFCAGLAGGLLCLAFGPPIWLGAALGAVLAVIAQTGDLFESSVKRRFGVKDSGDIIPGHGGLVRPSRQPYRGVLRGCRGALGFGRQHSDMALTAKIAHVQEPRRISILGSTGSVGCQHNRPDRARSGEL